MLRPLRHLLLASETGMDEPPTEKAIQSSSIPGEESHFILVGVQAQIQFILYTGHRRQGLPARRAARNPQDQQGYLPASREALWPEHD